MGNIIPYSYPLENLKNYKKPLLLKSEYFSEMYDTHNKKQNSKKIVSTYATHPLDLLGFILYLVGNHLFLVNRM